MSEDNNKILSFQSSVQTKVEDEINSILNQAEEQSLDMINKAKEQGLIRSFDCITEKTKIIKTDCKNKVAREEFNSFHNTLNKRNELIGEFFISIEQDLIQFTKSDDYKKFLEKKLKQVENEIPFYDGVKIQISLSDKEKNNLFESRYSDMLEGDKKIKIGGFSILYPCEKIYIDFTLDKKLRIERENFINHKELRI